MFFSSLTYAQESYEQTKRSIIEQVYSNVEYLPLIDIQQATIDLNTLKVSLDRIQDQTSLRKEQQESIQERASQLKIAIATILKDTQGTEQTIVRTLQSLSILKKKIEQNEEALRIVESDQRKTRDALKQYLRFMYTANNAYLTDTTTISTLRMLLNDEWLAYALSKKDFVKVLSENIVTLLDTLQKNEVRISTIIQTTQENIQSYTTQWVNLKNHMQYLDQQRTSVYELISYLNQESAALQSQVGRMEQSQQDLTTTKTMLERIVNSDAQQTNVLLQRSIEADKRSMDNNFYSRPFVGQPKVSHSREETKDSVRFELEHWTVLYSPAAWIVHEVQRSESSQLWWLVLLHKEWYATFMAPMNEVYVQAWDIIKRGQVVWRSWWKPWTWWAWIDATTPYFDFTVKKSWQSIDPLTLMDLSVFPEEEVVGTYQKWYIEDQWIRQVYVNAIDRMKWETLLERAYAFLRLYASWPFADPWLWYDWARETWINPILWMCIGFAETSFKNFKTPNNIWNVWNDDRWRTVTFPTPQSWVRALFNVFNNQYLWEYTLLNELSRFGNQEWFIYASSPYNRQKNIMNCLTSIYGYRVPEDFPFRIPKS